MFKAFVTLLIVLITFPIFAYGQVQNNLFPLIEKVSKRHLRMTSIMRTMWQMWRV